MKKMIAVAALIFLGCSSGSGGSSGSGVDGNWFYENSSETTGFGVTFTPNGTYAIVLLELTSGTSGDAEAETGTFTTNGNNINLTPQKWTCSGADPAYTVTYSFDGSDLILTTPSGVFGLQPNTATAMNSFDLTLGCFAADGGAFAPSPLAPVNP
jgi:hypothetical protein